MDRIMNIYKKIRVDSRITTWIVSALSLCLVAVVVLFLCIPDIKAQENEHSWLAEATGEYLLSTLPSGDSNNITTTKLDVVSNTKDSPYVIDGSSTSDKKNVSITVNYSGGQGTKANPAKVYVKLVNVNVEQSLDYSILKFSTNGSPVDFIVTVQGSCNLESTCVNAKKPVVSLEDTSYTLYRLKHPDGGRPTDYTLASYLTTEEHSKQVSLVLQGETPASKLNISNGRGSYGALIGTSESQTFTAEATGSLNALINSLNAAVKTEGEIVINNTDITAALKADPYAFTEYNYQSGVFEPQYKYKSTGGVSSGQVIIGGVNGEAPLVLTLTNSGYGAAIGGGGSEINSGKGANSGRVVINEGTINVKPGSLETFSPIFGSGIAKGATSPTSSYGQHGGVEINGGSFDFNGIGNIFGNVVPVNKEGNKLYPVDIDTLDDETSSSILTVDTFAHNTVYPIKKFTYDKSLQFDVRLEDWTKCTVIEDNSLKYFSMDVTLSPTLSYEYRGRGHGNTKLQFWLPAIQTTALTITDEFGPGYTKFTLKRGSGDVIEPVSDDLTSQDSRKYVLTRGDTYYLIAENIPSGLKVKNVALSTGGNANYNAALGYQITASEAAVTANVTYSGSIEIVYDDGLLDEDRANHTLTMPTLKYEYGTENFALPIIGNTYKQSVYGYEVLDLSFAGWVYTDKDGNELGNITHIVKSQSFDGNQRKYADIVQSDGKIYLKAKWDVIIDYVIGDEATVGGTIPSVKVNYAYGTGHVMDVTITNLMPMKDSFAFAGWSLDGDETVFYNYTEMVGAVNTVSVSTLTSHIFYANYERTGFSIYVDASTLDQNFAQLSCMGTNGLDMLAKNPDGSLATVVIEGKTYYYSSIVRKDSAVRVIIKTKHGYMMENTSMKVIGSASSDVRTDSILGECVADIVVKEQDVYITTNASFKPVEYEIVFKDGKEPNELLWSGTKFYYDIEDIEANKTVGDIIREGLRSTTMSDEAIVAYINTIDKNNRFTDFSGWSLPFYSESLGMDKTIASIYKENSNITYGDLVFTAIWKEYDKYTIDVSLLERIIYSDGSYKDKESGNLVPVLYYYSGGSDKIPIYTEDVIDSATGEVKTYAYAKAGDKIEIELYRKNKYGRPYGEAVTEGIYLSELYYEYNSKINEDVRADIKDGSKTFTIKNDVKDGTVIRVTMAYTIKEFNIVYWDLRGFDNSVNPTTYTIFDEFDFTPIAEGVDWLLVCPDEDNSNDDDITTEVIYGIRQNGKLITDGIAGERDYIANIILKPDWSTYKEDRYNIDIHIDNEAFGTISILYPEKATEFFANDMVLLRVEPREGYKLVANSLTYRKQAPAVRRGLSARIVTRQVDTYNISAVDVENGIYILTMPNSDIVVSAMFELCQYSITYSDVAQDVINMNPLTYNINSSIELTDAVRDGYTFLGWFDQYQNKITKIEGMTGNLVLTPKFELIEAPDEPEDKPQDKPDEPENNLGDKPENNEGDNTSNKPQNKPDNGNGNSSGTVGGATIAGRPSNVVSRPSDIVINVNKPTTNGSGAQNSVQGGTQGGIQTGDTADIPRLVLICVAAVLVLMIIVIKKPKNKDDE